MNIYTRIKLKLTGYNNPQQYWNTRWTSDKPKPENDWYAHTNFILNIMKETDSKNVLEVGCGYGMLKTIPNYTGLDFSLEVLKRGCLEEFIYADISKHIPVPDQTFDMVFTSNVLLHIKPDEIDKAISEIFRVAKKVVVIVEPPSTPLTLSKHCFNHDYKTLTKNYKIKVLIANE